MSLRLIMGGSKAGKSSRLYQMVIERSLSEPDSRLLLIVPEQYTMQTQKKIVQLHPRHAVMNIDILSFERLAYRIFEETGTSMKTILDDTGKSMILRRILSENEEKMGAFRGNVRRPGFVDQVKSMISELMQYNISPESLAKKMPLVGADTRLFVKLKDIQLIYQRFVDFIHERYITAEEVLSVLASVIDKSEIIPGSSIFMDNFTGFTPVQYALMEKLLLLSPEVVLTLSNDVTTDPYDSSDQDDLFFITRNTITRLEAICRKNHVGRDEDILLRRDETIRAGREDIFALEENIFRKKIKVFQEKPEHITICKAADPDDEMRFAAMKIHELVRDRGLRYSQIALVASDMEGYVSFARKWFDKYKIPCFFDSRKSLSGNMLVEWMRSLLQMLRYGMNYESVFRFLHSGLSPLSREETDILENYVIAYGIRGEKRWLSPFTAGEKIEGPEKLEKLNELRLRFISPLTDLLPLMGKKKTDTASLVRIIYKCMEESALRRKIDDRIKLFEEAGDLDRVKEYEQIYDVMTGILERIFIVLSDEEMTIKEFSDVMETGIAQMRLGIIPPGLDQVTFGDLRRTRLDNVSFLIFAGVNEGLVPMMSHPSGLISDSEREILMTYDLELAPTAAENLCTERFYIYSCLTKPGDRLMLTYSVHDKSGGDLLPASLIRQIRDIFPQMGEMSSAENKNPDIIEAYNILRKGFGSLSSGLAGNTAGSLNPADAEQSAGSLKSADTEQSAGSLKSAGSLNPAEKGESFESETSLLASIYSWFIAHPSYEKNARLMKEAALFHYGGDSLSQAAVKAVYNGRLEGGVTMLEQYAQCAYAHFLIYGLHLAKRRIYQVQAPDIGNIFHKAIEIYSKRVARSGLRWKEVDEKTRDEWVEQAVKSAADGYKDNMMHDTYRAAFLTDRIADMAKRTVWAMTAQLKKGDMEPEGYEFKFASALSSDNITLLNSDNGTVYLSGKIDRLDCCQDNGNLYMRILDYKTSERKFDLSSVYHGLTLQLVVYMNAAKEAYDKSNKAMVIPAGIFYYNIDDPMIETEEFKNLARKIDRQMEEKEAVPESQDRSSALADQNAEPLSSRTENDNSARNEELSANPENETAHLTDPENATEHSTNETAHSTSEPVYSETEIAILEKLALNGLVLEDGEAIRHMDASPETKPKIIPVKFNKGGDISKLSSTASPDNFFLISKYVKDKTAEIARDIFSGEIDAAPYKYGNKNACTYCDFKSVCGFNTGIDGYSYRFLRKMKDEEVFSAMARKGGGENGD